MWMSGSIFLFLLKDHPLWGGLFVLLSSDWKMGKGLLDMGRIAIFIDAAYLQFMLKNEFGTARIDFQKLVTKIADGREILRSYYYDCEPYQSDPPTPQERDRFRRCSSSTTAWTGSQDFRYVWKTCASWLRQRKTNL